MVFNVIEKRVRQAWKDNGMYAGDDPEEEEYLYNQYKDGFMSQVADADGNINPETFASAVFTSQSDAEKFPQAYKIYKAIFPRVGDALAAPKGIPGIANVPIAKDLLAGANRAVADTQNSSYNSDVTSKSAKDSILGGFRDMAAATGKKTDSAESDASQIILSSANADEMSQRMLQYLKLNDQSSYLVLKKAGLVP